MLPDAEVKLHDPCWKLDSRGTGSHVGFFAAHGDAVRRLPPVLVHAHCATAARVERLPCIASIVWVHKGLVRL